MKKTLASCLILVVAAFLFVGCGTLTPNDGATTDDLRPMGLNVRGNQNFTGRVNLGGEWRIDGTEVTATAAELNTMDGITATVSELNAMDGITATVTELNQLDGVTISDGSTVGAVTAAAGSAAEYEGALRRTVITFTNITEIATDGSDEGESQLLYTFPEGRILIIGAAIDTTNSVATNAFNASTDDIYYTAIGTAAAGDDADLTGTEADIIAKASNDTTSDTVLDFSWEADMTAGGDSVFDGTATAVKLYYNFAVADASTKANVTNTMSVGSLAVDWVFLGDD